MKLPLRRAFLVLLTVFLISCSGGSGSSSASVDVFFNNADGTISPVISAELATTPEERSLGLMYRKSMPERGGMLFVFPENQDLAFWMKNTYLELDMVFIDSAKRVVNVVEKATPLTEEPRRSARPARYVLEILGGMASKWGIREGSEAHFDM